jgi:hypothetical protein
LPKFEDGILQNISILDGYGPFRTAIFLKNEKEKPYFLNTLGAGIGRERSLYAMLNGPGIEKINDVTCFRKNPDLFPIFIY